MLFSILPAIHHQPLSENVLTAFLHGHYEAQKYFAPLSEIFHLFCNDKKENLRIKLAVRAELGAI